VGRPPESTEVAEIPGLTEDEWAELLERLTHHCVRKFRMRGWWKNGRRFDRAGLGGVSPQDLAQEAIVSIIDGTRSYDPKKHPDLLKHLKSIADSRISHLASAKETKTTHCLLAENPKTREAVPIDPLGDEPDPAEMAANREVVGWAKEAIAVEAEKDPRVLELFECWEAEITKPAEVAEYLGVDVTEIYNVQKRLRRLVEKECARRKEGRP